MEVESEGEVVTGLTSNPIKDRPPCLTTGPADGSPPHWHISAPFSLQCHPLWPQPSQGCCHRKVGALCPRTQVRQSAPFHTSETKAQDQQGRSFILILTHPVC